MKVKRSEYIIISRILCRILFKANCWGKGSMYFDNLAKSLCEREISKTKISKEKVEAVLFALEKQKICGRKMKKHGWKYYLNMDRYEKIMQIIKETGQSSIIPLLLHL